MANGDRCGNELAETPETPLDAANKPPSNPGADM
jgi:hypothetical protein